LLIPNPKPSHVKPKPDSAVRLFFAYG